MENKLIALQKRIKGAKLWNKNGSERLYIPLTHINPHVKPSAYIEVVNDSLQIIVKMRSLSEKVHQNLCDMLAIEYQKKIYEQYYELLTDTELKRRRVPLDIRLKDDTVPISHGSMPHQEAALKFLCSMKVSAFFGDVGVGKSKVAIDLAISRFVAGKIDKVLVLCPVSLINNFKYEVDKFCDTNELQWQYFGTDSISMSDRIYLEALNSIDNSTMLIIDESHFLKSHKAIRSNRVKDIADKCTYKLIMTGTAYSEDVSDLFMQYSILNEGIIKCNSWDSFANQFLIFSDIDYNEIVGYKNLDYLTSLIEPYTFYVDKHDCLTLPPITEQVITCELNSNQKHYYEKIKIELLDKLEDANSHTSREALVFTYLTMLQQIACGYLHYGDESEYLGTNKFDILDKFDLSGQTIFFCKYIFETHLLLEYLGKEKCALYSGENPSERNKEKDKFTSGEKQYFVATLASGGTGINGLQVCNRIVFFSNSFKYHETKQAIGRIERKGQEAKQLHITYLMSEAGIDSKITKNLTRKRNMIQEINRLLKEDSEIKKYIESL